MALSILLWLLQRKENAWAPRWVKKLLLGSRRAAHPSSLPITIDQHSQPAKLQASQTINLAFVSQTALRCRGPDGVVCAIGSILRIGRPHRSLCFTVHRWCHPSETLAICSFLHQTVLMCFQTIMSTIEFGVICRRVWSFYQVFCLCIIKLNLRLY